MQYIELVVKKVEVLIMARMALYSYNLDVNSTNTALAGIYGRNIYRSF